MNKLKPLVWEQGQPIGGGWIDPILVSINDLAEFAIVPDSEECEGKPFKLEINYSGGMWDCFCYDSIEQCQDRANAWWKEKIENCFIFEIPAIKLEQCIACNGLGQIARLSKGDTAFKYNFETCKTCGGEGKVNCETSKNPAQ